MTHAAATITLERTPCFGACPTFTLEVAPGGQASLSLPSNRLATSVATEPNPPIVLTERIEADQYQRLVETLEAGHFASLDQDYKAPISDMPGTTISFTSAGHTATTHVYGVRCVSQAQREERDTTMGPATLVPDVFCDAAQQLDAIACAIYTGHKASIPNGLEARFPPRCEAPASAPV